jgi:hypothetical protein
MTGMKKFRDLGSEKNEKIPKEKLGKKKTKKRCGLLTERGCTTTALHKKKSLISFFFFSLIFHFLT